MADETLPPVMDAESAEAREDSLALRAAYAAQDLIIPAVSAKTETDQARAGSLADAADDPAVWRHPTDGKKSLIFGSNKTGGLAAYDLEGREVDYYPIGKINNVDILEGVRLGGATVSLLGCSNRTDQSVDLFSIDPETGKLTDVASGSLPVDSTKIDDVYGFCLARNVKNEDVYAIINGKNGRVQQFLLEESEGRLSLKLVREIAIPSQTEGMVADNELGWLYIGEENRGLWKLPLVPGEEEVLGAEAQVQWIVEGAEIATNDQLVADVEGLSLLSTGAGTGYLVLSSQGNFSYAVFDRAGDNAFLGSFKIVDGPGIDGVEETDGLEVVAGNFGPDFPEGMLVVQDGFNYDDQTLRPQNFKLVDWREVISALSLSEIME
ncbi:phytase [Neolewinella agarilytica]|uniref:3-phytase n=1 Tax=Neolewinella agarilytica TaxID=478744 RepID=A0A1H9MXP5_9BACT|nr:phytase [Neolewinella agarilytica]SER28462.1 3-phytase [Neolewinella agarilytica]